MNTYTGVGFKPLYIRKKSRNRRRPRQDYIPVTLGEHYQKRALTARRRQRLRVAAVVIYFAAFAAMCAFIGWPE